VKVKKCIRSLLKLCRRLMLKVNTGIKMCYLIINSSSKVAQIRVTKENQFLEWMWAKWIWLWEVAHSSNRACLTCNKILLGRQNLEAKSELPQLETTRHFKTVLNTNLNLFGKLHFSSVSSKFPETFPLDSNILLTKSATAQFKTHPMKIG